MALPVSEKIQLRKKVKFEKELTKVLGNSSTEELTSYLQELFQTNNPPNARQLIKMISSAKFGGDNYWNAAATGPKIIFNLVNSVWPQLKRNLEELDPDLFNDEHPINFNNINKTTIGYLLCSVNIFPKIGKHLETINVADFKQASEISPFLYLEKETNSYGFCYIPLKGERPENVEEFLKDSFFINKRVPWQTEGFPDYTPDGNFKSGALTYVFPFLLYIGTVEELIDCIPDREIIDVATHLRHYTSGKVSLVKGYKKRKPMRANEVIDDITSHIVYRVYDHEENLRYIGEGKVDRYKHVNSGASHNVKINEHFFTKGEMRVEIVDEGLTKGEARAFERAILNQLRGTNLWNKKDFEPFVEEFDKGYSDKEVSEYFCKRVVNPL